MRSLENQQSLSAAVKVLVKKEREKQLFAFNKTNENN